MPFNVAREALQRHLSETNYDEVIIDFFGGEPFLEFEVMREIVDYVENLNLEKAYFFSATTNGTRIHGDVQTWLMSKRNKYHVTLSLDGTKEMHDHNRSRSYSSIDFPFFQKAYGNHTVKMTLSPETLPHLAAGVKHIHSLGFKVANNLAYGPDWSMPVNIMILERELKTLIEYYLDNPDIEPCRLLSMKIVGVVQRGTPKKWCGVGTNMVTIDVDGQEYPCHAFLPVSIGEEQAAISQRFEFGEMNLVDEPCITCLLLPICPTCYGANLYKNGSPKLRDGSLCNLTKVTALACSYFEAQKILRDNNKDKHHSRDMIEAISKIQKEIAIGNSEPFPTPI